MTPNDFGIIRQADHNLFAMLFPPLTDASEYDFEIIQPEYEDGYRFTLQNKESNDNQACAIVDISGYTNCERIFIPVASYGGTAFSGTKNTLTLPASFGSCIQAQLTHSFSYYNIPSCYGCIVKAPNYNYVYVSDYIQAKRPIILALRKRNDHVNPLGVIQPLNPGILRPQVEDPDAPEEEQEET